MGARVRDAMESWAKAVNDFGATPHSIWATSLCGAPAQ